MTESRVDHLTPDQWGRIFGKLFDADLAATSTHVLRQRGIAHWDKNNRQMVARGPMNFSRLFEPPRPWPWR